jgi:hypothetical protein
MFKSILPSLMLLACASCGGSASPPATTCSRIDTFQCAPPDCYPTWAELEASAPHCGDPSGWRETRGSCDRYDLHLVHGVDYDRAYYYDKASGALVAAAGQTNTVAWCAAGAGGVPSAASCPTDGVTVDPCAADAGR